MSAAPIKPKTGDFFRSDLEDIVYPAIDEIGTVRNAVTGIQSGLQIADTAGKITGIFAGAVTPIMLIAGGALAVGSAAIDTIPNAYKEYRRALTLRKNVVPPQKTENASAPIPTQRDVDLANEGVTAARMNLANKCLYGAMGGGMIASGALTLMSPIGAGALGFDAVVGATAATGAGIALGGIYTVRGPVIVAKSLHALNYLNKFEKDFKDDIQAALDSSPEDLKANVSAIVEKFRTMEQLGRGKENPERYLSYALELRIGTEKVPSKDATLQVKIDYLTRVDRGIYKNKLMHKICLTIGISMTIGGLMSDISEILLLMGKIMSDGLALPWIGLISSIFFLAMEGIYISFDSSTVLDKVFVRLYKQSPEIQQLIIKAQLLQQQAAQQPLITTASELAS